jgi:hypothetical protein
VLEFSFALYTLVRPGTSGSPDFILLEKLVDLELSLAGFPSRTAVRDEFLLIRAAASFLRTNWYADADEVDKSIMQFLEKIFSKAVQADLMETFKLAHDSDLPSISMAVRNSLHCMPMIWRMGAVRLPWATDVSG